jgi:hypothetical protein
MFLTCELGVEKQVVSFRLWLLYPWVNNPLPPYSLNKRLYGRALEPVWTLWEREKSLTLAQNQTLISCLSVPELIAVLTELSWFLTVVEVQIVKPLVVLSSSFLFYFL